MNVRKIVGSEKFDAYLIFAFMQELMMWRASANGLKTKI